MSQPLNTINEPKNESIMIHVILIDEYSFIFEIKDGKRYAIHRPKNDTWLSETVSIGDTLLVQFVEHETTHKGIPKTNVRLEFVKKLGGEFSMDDPEPLRMTETFIRHFPESGYYNFEVADQYGRWWIYGGMHDSLDEIEEIEAEELRKGILNLDLYHFDDDRIVERIKRQEEVWYVYRLNKYGYLGDGFDTENGAEVVVMTKDGLEYIHDKIFYDYDKLKAFALKVKEKGIINLEVWRCQGNFEWDGESSHSYLQEFEEKIEYDDEPQEWSRRDIYNSLGGEDGERKYMSDGAWINPDGTIDFER